MKPATTAGETTLVPGPIYGIRKWSTHWRGDRPVLRAAVQGGRWKGGGEPTKARCRFAKEDHDAPDPHCGCGLYGVHPARYEEWAKSRFGVPDLDPGSEVLGVIEAWGRVELHRDGFRAEYAKPHAIVRIGGTGVGGTRAIAERHRVGHLSFDSTAELLSYCESHGLGLSEGSIRDLVPAGPSYGPGYSPPSSRTSIRSFASSLGELALALVTGGGLLVGYALVGILSLTVMAMALGAGLGWLGIDVDTSPPTKIRQVKFDPETCKVTARVKSDDAVKRLRLRLVAKDSSGNRISGGTGTVTIQDVPEGTRRLRLATARGELCKAPIATVGVRRIKRFE